MKTEVVKEVAAARRKQHLSSLQYYCALNALQYRKRMAMMEPMLGFAHGQVGSPSLRRRNYASCGGQHGLLLGDHRGHTSSVRGGNTCTASQKLSEARHLERLRWAGPSVGPGLHTQGDDGLDSFLLWAGTGTAFVSDPNDSRWGPIV